MKVASDLIDRKDDLELLHKDPIRNYQVNWVNESGNIPQMVVTMHVKNLDAAKFVVYLKEARKHIKHIDSNVQLTSLG